MRLKKTIVAAAFAACLLGITSVFGVSAFADTPETVNIPDATLKAAVIDALELSSGNITADDMAKLTVLETPVNDPALKIKDITGLEYAVNLEVLNLDYNKITDLTPIAGLTKLKDLDISYNDGAAEGTDGITDISCLSGLTNLERFASVGNAGVTDYSVVSEFTNLKYLNLNICGLSDISFVSGLTQLESLYLAFNGIYDIVPLQNLTSLKTLALGTNRLQDVSVLSRMTQLEQLTLENNYIEDFSAVLGLSALNYLDVSRNFLSDEQMMQIMDALENADTVYTSPVADDSKKAELICLNIYSKTMQVGESFVLTASEFDGTPMEGIAFSSSDTQVASVSQDGIVTATGSGFCYIGVTHDGYTRLCTVTVSAADGGDGGDAQPDGGNTGLIVGITVGAAVVVAAVIVAVVLVRRRKK